MSDVVEVPGARALLRSLLPRPGHPQVVLRLGIGAESGPAPATPRRPMTDLISDDGHGSGGVDRGGGG
jgi:hypothetical protein